MKPTVFVTRRIPERGLALLRDRCQVSLWDSDDVIPRAELLRAVAKVDGLLCLLTDQVDAKLLAAAPRLRVVSNMAVGYDNVDVKLCTRRRIPVGNTPGVLTETTADFTWALILAAARRLAEGIDHVRAGKWTTWGPMLLLGQDIHGATLGILGMGRIGTAVARRARGFSMRILYHDVRPNEDAERATGAALVDFDTLLRESDFLTIHTTLNPSTHHLINAEAITKMKSNAILINTARGPIVHPWVLYGALRANRIFAAALDVTEPEPIPADHPLLTLPNCLIVPHIASASVATRTKMAVMAAENLLAGLRRERLPNCVNPSVYAARRR
jgi:lactate dehydrogenase-like 2-hydroxyacid dehydrogenase